MAVEMTLENGYQCCQVCGKRDGHYVVVDGLPYCDKHAKGQGALITVEVVEK